MHKIIDVGTWAKLDNILSVLRKVFHLLTPEGDQDRISHNNINTIPSRQVLRIKKVNQGIINWSNTKFAEFYGRQQGELLMRS